MRLLTVSLLPIALVLLSVSGASAITLRLENTADPNQVAVYLDMEGDQTAGVATKVFLINIGVDTTDADLTYLGAEPAPTIAQIGNQPGIMLSNSFAWLKPTVAYGQESVALDVPAGKTRALLDFFNDVSTDGANSGNENVLMGTLNYDGPVDASFFDLQFGADGGFFADDGTGFAVPINGQVNLVNNVPEPGAAAMGLAALASLGVLRRTIRQR
jgi:hypothetical protein